MNKSILEFFQNADKKIVSYDNIVNFTFIINNDTEKIYKSIKFRQETNLIQDNSFISATKNGIEFDINIEGNQVALGDIKQGEKIEVQINIVISKSFKEDLRSVGVLEYSTEEGASYKIESNEESVEFRGADFQQAGELKLYCDREYATVGDEVLIGIDIENKGNISGDKVFISDILPENCDFVQDSLMINESIVDFHGGIETINIGQVNLFQRISVKYKIKVNNDIKEDVLKHRVTLKYENVLSSVDITQKIIKSNEVLLNIRLVKIDDFTKISSKKEATIGDRVKFVIEGKNTGNLKLYDVILKDTIDDSFNLIEDSVIINGVKAYNSNFQCGILLETLNAGDGFRISYEAIVKDFYNGDLKRSKLIFKFEGADGQDYISKTIESSECSIVIKAPDIKASRKVCNKKSAFLGEEVMTTIFIENKGNTACENVSIIDKLPDYLEFIPNTLYIQGEKIYSSEIGEVSIPYIESEGIGEISYRAKIIDIPKYNRNDNRVKIIYNYIVEDKNYTKENIFYGEDIVVNGAIIKKNNIVKTVDRIYGIIGDEITYNITFKNEGNFSCERVFIKEEECRSLEFISNSLNINGVEMPYNIFKGFLYGEVDGLETCTMSFRCRIKSIPYSSILQGITHISYEYRGENGSKRIKKEVTAKSEEVIVKSAIIDSELGIFTKETSSNVAMVNDKIPIRIHLRNMGNTEAYNVVLKDEPVRGLEIIEDSFSIDSIKEKYPGNIINLGNLKVNEEREIIYFAKINKEVENKITSRAKVEYCFYGNDGGILIRNKGVSKDLNINIFYPSLVITESVNKDSFEVGEIVNYNLYITNNGNTDLSNLKLSLNIGELEGVNLNELTINRRIIRGAKLSDNIEIGEITKNESISICMKIELNKLLMKNSLIIIPKIQGEYEGNDNIINNVNFTTEGKEVFVSLNRLALLKTTANTTYLKGDIVNYLITVRNDGTNTAENVIVYDDSITIGFIEDSLTINGYPVEESFVSGIPIGSLKQGECVFIRYSAIYGNDYIYSEVVSKVKGTAEFFDSKYGYMKKEFYSDELNIGLVKASLNVIKTADKRVVAYGDKVNFITTVENNGTIPLKNMIFIENMNVGFEAVNSCIYVNGSKVIKGDSKKGIVLPLIKPQEIFEISTLYIYKNYKRVIRINSDSLINYEYNLNGVKDSYSGEAISNKVLLEGEIATFKNITVDHEVNLGEDEVWVLEVTDVIVVPKITKSYVVKTIQNTSYGNEHMTGYKLIIRGILEEKIEYIANTEQESVHMTIHEERFSTSIILPEQHDINEAVNINTLVHEVFPKVIDERRIQISVNLTVEGLI